MSDTRSDSQSFSSWEEILVCTWRSDPRGFKYAECYA